MDLGGGGSISEELELALVGDADPLTSTDPRRADSDGDQLDDGVEDANRDGAVSSDETHPRLSDSDADGIADDVELRLGTNPLAVDSDGDWVSDAEEVGSDPEAAQDFDGDELIDALDDDSDADMVPDAVEAGDEDLRTPRPDTDRDGHNDLQDVDSDNGGIPDGMELQVRHTNRLDPSDDGRGWFDAGTQIRGSGCAVSTPGRAGSGALWFLCLLAGVRGLWRRPRKRAWIFWLACCALPPYASQAQEHPDARQTAVDGSPYRMNPSGDTVLSTSLPSVLSHLQWQVRLAAHHFADSIVVANADGNVRRSILDNRQQLELAAAVGLFDFAELSAHWAIAPHQSATFPAEGLGATGAFGVTHPVLHPKLNLLRQPNAPFSLGVEAPVTLGLWKPQPYMGRDGASVSPAVLLSWQGRALIAAVSAGVELGPSARIYRTRDGSRFVYLAALQYAPQAARWRVGVEWSATHRLADPWDRDEQTGQIAGGFGYRFTPSWSVDATLGAGVLGGIGQPQYRALIAAAYRAAPRPRPPASVEKPAPAPQPPAPAAAPVTPAEPAEPTPSAPTPQASAPEPALAADSGKPALSPPGPGSPQILQSHIHFPVADSAFAAESFATLDQLLQLLEARPELRLRIEGHSDSLGDRKANTELSLRRAETVRAYLVEHSRDPHAMGARLETVGYGELHPVDTNATESGRALNRHVSFSVLGSGP